MGAGGGWISELATDERRPSTVHFTGCPKLLMTKVDIRYLATVTYFCNSEKRNLLDAIYRK